MWELPRRRVLTLAAGAGGSVAIGGSIIYRSSDPTIAAEGLTARDVAVSSDDGELTSLSITPEVVVRWEGQPADVGYILAAWYVETEDVARTPIGPSPHRIEVASPDTSGQREHQFPEMPLLTTYGGPLDADAFTAPIEGLTTTRAVTIGMDVTLETPDRDEIVAETDVLGPRTFTVSVTNAVTSPNNGGGGGGAEVTGPGEDTDPDVDTSGTANVNAS